MRYGTPYRGSKSMAAKCDTPTIEKLFIQKKIRKGVTMEKIYLVCNSDYDRSPLFVTDDKAVATFVQHKFIAITT